MVLEEPTTGLHFRDVECLLKVLRKIVDAGTTLIIIEHSTDLIRHADWLVELGPGSAHEGGELIFQGKLAKMKSQKRSKISEFLV